MAIITFALVLLLALGLGLYSRVGVKSTEDFMVGGRSFGPILLFILVVGEVYSIGTVIGFPGGIYAQGAEFGMWFMGYILLCYPIGYFLLPLLWRAGRRYGAITLPDVFRGHFGSRTLEIVAAAVCVIFLIPWAQLQLTGLTVALDGLGLGLSPLTTVLIGVGISLVFTLLAGIKAPAYVSFVKDFALIFAIIVVAVFVLARDPHALTTITRAPGITEHITIAPGASLTKTLSTLLFQAVGFHMFPFMVQAAMTSASGRAVKKTQIWMPLYMLMYPFLILVAYYALATSPGLQGAKTNLAFMQVARAVLPDWLVGVVAGGAALCAIVVLAASSLCIGTLISRNVVRGVSEARQQNVARVVITIYLVLSIALTLLTPNLMAALNNTAYYGFTQLIVPVVVVMTTTRVRPGTLALGLAGGVVTALVLYATGAKLGGLNLGVPALAVNIALVLLGRWLRPAEAPTPGLLVRGRGPQTSTQEVAPE